MKNAATFLTDAEVMERVLSHIDNSDTDRGETIWREPVANYMSEDRLAAERAMIASAAGIDR